MVELKSIIVVAIILCTCELPIFVNCQNQNGTGLEGRAQTGGNFAFYNESCGTGKICILSKNLTCDEDICKCEIHPIPLIYIDHVNIAKCVPEPMSRNQWACEFDQQCQKSSFGKYSQCSQDSRQCICGFDPNGKPLVQHQDVCYIVKKIGDACDSHEECNMTIPGEAVCNGVVQSSEAGTGVAAAGICACAENHIFNSTVANECMPLKMVNESCRFDIQCQHVNSLGELARCSDSKICECFDTNNPVDKQQVGYYLSNANLNQMKGKCHYVKYENDTCSTSEECILGYHRNAACLQHPSYNAERICQCSVNKTCILDEHEGNPSGAGRLTNIPVSILLVSILNMVLIKNICA